MARSNYKSVKRQKELAKKKKKELKKQSRLEKKDNQSEDNETLPQSERENL